MKKRIYEIPQVCVTTLKSNQIICASPFSIDGDNVKVGLTSGEGDFGTEDEINARTNPWGDIWE